MTLSKDSAQVKELQNFRLINHLSTILMSHKELPVVFVTHAAEILGDTDRGLSGSQIVRLTAAHAIDAGVDIPHSSYPFTKMGINKRTALFQNLMAFPSNAATK